MVTIASGKASIENLPGRRRALDDTQRTFLAKASSLGVQASPLVLGKPARVFPWIRRNEDFLCVSWGKRKVFSFLGLLEVSWITRNSGIFRKYPATKVLMPLEAERAAQALKTIPGIEEMAVLEERRIDPIFAVRVAGQWYEIHRWWQSPVVLPDDCPLITAQRAETCVPSGDPSRL